MPKYVIKTTGLKKIFTSKQGPIIAVNGIDLTVKPGEVFGFLGPNGAGKTTTLRILTTLMQPDAGQATVAGYNVVTQPDKVRLNIGYVSQSGGSDRAATGQENLILQGRLYGMTARNAQDRAAELTKVLDLSDFARRIVNTYSGGQRRRLDVALGIMNRPAVLFLDEPTTGLDPHNRANLWEQIEKLQQMGTTVFLTTHYLEEADMLSDRVAIIDHGSIIASGTPSSLKKAVSGDVIALSLRSPQKDNFKVLAKLRDQSYVSEVKEEGSLLRLYVDDGAATIPKIIRLLDKLKLPAVTITLAVPTLDDVFLKATGRSLRDVNAGDGGAR